MCAVSPGWLVPGFGHRDDDFQPHYPSEEAFLFALAAAMREEYKAIVDAGFILQIDDPRVVSGWDVPDPRTNSHLTLEDYRKEATLRIEALNHALEGIPAERVRHHVCWGSWKGPHTVDIPLKDAIDIILRVKAQAHSIEAANVRHEHEWKVWQDVHAAGWEDPHPRRCRARHEPGRAPGAGGGPSGAVRQPGGAGKRHRGDRLRAGWSAPPRDCLGQVPGARRGCARLATQRQAAKEGKVQRCVRKAKAPPMAERALRRPRSGGKEGPKRPSAHAVAERRRL